MTSQCHRRPPIHLSDFPPPPCIPRISSASPLPEADSHVHSHSCSLPSAIYPSSPLSPLPPHSTVFLLLLLCCRGPARSPLTLQEHEQPTTCDQYSTDILLADKICLIHSTKCRKEAPAFERILRSSLPTDSSEYPLPSCQTTTNFSACGLGF